MARDDIDPGLDAWYRRRTIDIADDKARRDHANWLGLADTARRRRGIEGGASSAQSLGFGGGEANSRFQAMAATPSRGQPAITPSRTSVGAQTGGSLVDNLEGDFGGLAEAQESSHKGPRTIGRQPKDPGGASYGTYQFSSNRGALGEFLRASGYDVQFAGLTPGTPDFDAKWVALADGDPEFGKAQKRYGLKTYYEQPMERLRREGVDLTGRGRAVREAVFSTSIQHGQNAKLLGRALADLDLNTATDRQIVDAIQQYKLDNVVENFPDTAADQRERIAREKRMLDEIVGVEELMALRIPYIF